VHAEDRAVEVDVLTAGEFRVEPVPTSSSELTRPRMTAWPFVGSTIRLSTLSSVDLPAPLRPITPSTSPRATSKLMSLSAQ
jgi:hypothetical protein